MNFSNPIMICDETEDVRVLIRDMLTKNGFFHLIEASNTDEAIGILRGKKDYLVLVQAGMLSGELTTLLQEQKNFIIFADNKNAETPLLAAKLGIHHIMSYPFHSRKLMDKINSLL